MKVNKSEGTGRAEQADPEFLKRMRTCKACRRLLRGLDPKKRHACGLTAEERRRARSAACLLADVGDDDDDDQVRTTPPVVGPQTQVFELAVNDSDPEDEEDAGADLELKEKLLERRKKMGVKTKEKKMIITEAEAIMRRGRGSDDDDSDDESVPGLAEDDTWEPAPGWDSDDDESEPEVDYEDMCKEDLGVQWTPEFRDTPRQPTKQAMRRWLDTEVSCLFANKEDDKVQEKQDLLGSDAYLYEWEDVPKVYQDEALARMVQDYDSTDSWDRSSDTQKANLVGQLCMPARHVLKAKVYDGILMARARWTPKGFFDKIAGKQDTESPTASKVTHRTCAVLGKSAGWRPFTLDFAEAFFWAEPIPAGERRPWIEVPKEDPAYKPGLYRQLKKYVPGTKQAPRSWYMTLKKGLKQHVQCVQSKVDPCLFWIMRSKNNKKDVNNKEKRLWHYAGYVGTHVDDLKGRIDIDYVHWFEESINGIGRGDTKVQWQEVGDSVEFCGETESEHDTFLTWDQDQYLDKKIVDLMLEASRRPQHQDKYEATEEEISHFRSVLGKCGWTTWGCRPDRAFETSWAAQRVTNLKVKHMKRFRKVPQHLRHIRYKWKVPTFDLTKGIRLVIITDAGENEDEDGNLSWTKAQGGIMIGIMQDAAAGSDGDFAGVLCRSFKEARTTSSSYDAESVAAVVGVDSAIALQFLIQEFFVGVRPSRRERIARQVEGEWDFLTDAAVCALELHTDCDNLVKNVENLQCISDLSKRRKIDIADLRELRDRGELRRLVHVAGEFNPTDALTKKPERTVKTTERLIEILSTGYYKVIHKQAPVKVKKK